MRTSIPEVCDHRTPSYIFDANGWKRWCGLCHAPLNHDPETERFNALVFVPFFLAVGIAILFFLVVNAGIDRGSSPVAPVTYGPSPVVHSVP